MGTTYTEQRTYLSSREIASTSKQSNLYYLLGG